jgi:prepilin-type N-terminal cleavage/methylation domain-containing protein
MVLGEVGERGWIKILRERRNPMRQTRQKNRTRRTEAFTLIELMLVVTLIAIITAIALPNWAGARKAANEVAAISAMRSLCTAQTHYRLRFGSYGSLADLTASTTVDDGFSDALRSGYVFSSTVAPTATRWEFNADPATPGITGDRHFFVDTSGVIRFQEAATATATDPAIDS